MSMQFTQSATLKVLGIGMLVLLMLIPLAEVQHLIGERIGMRQSAIDAIAQGWGGEQEIGGPVLVVPRHDRIQTNTGWTTRDVIEVLLPDTLAIDAKLATEQRRYGIYSTPVYVAQINIDGRFIAKDFANLPDAQDYDWSRAEVRVPVSDVHGIRSVSPLKLGNIDHEFGPAEIGVAGFSAIAVPLDATELAKSGGDFHIEMSLAGTESLQLLPLARHTDAHMSAPWKNPTFSGRFLPAEHTVDAKHFDATWRVLDLNRRFGQHWQQSDMSREDVRSAAFGTGLYQPANVYQQNERAGKYGLLFIALTFVAFFLFEVLKRLRLHPVQYLLVGFALATFYVVLLALSEQIGFGGAYLAAAMAVVVMTGAYAAAILHSARGGLVLGAMMALVYALLYGLIQSEEYSLLMGAIALLAVVATLMHLTRNVDWYAATASVAPTLAPRN